MSKKRLLISILLIISFISLPTFAEKPDREPLWPNGAPMVKGEHPVNDTPAITIYSPPETNKKDAAIIICPGGGYGGHAMNHEGHQIAEWLNTHGITGIIVEYRMNRGGYQHPVPLMDAQRAIRTVRSRAKELGISPNKIGILGFSAGGHLASSTGVHFETVKPAPNDPIDKISSRPDFMILCYPVIAFDEPYTHKGSQKNLLGKDAPKDLVEKMSTEKQITKDTPPTFLFHTDEDRPVPAENSVQFYLALRKAKVPAEMHIYKKGGHGVGLGLKIPGTRNWSNACINWLKNMKFID